MKAIYWIIATAALVCSESAQAQVVPIVRPETIIYRFPGVLDDGVSILLFEASRATLFHCTNFSGQDEYIRFVTRSSDTSIVSNVVVPIPHLATKTIGTSKAGPYEVHANLLTGFQTVQGTTALAATTTNIICTAMVIDKTTNKPDGIALRGIRFSPVPGSQE